MKYWVLGLLFFAFSNSFVFAQTKVSGYVYDSNKQSVPFANIVFVNSTIGTITDENGKFYMESDQNHSSIKVSFIGFETKTIKLSKRTTYNMEVVLEEEAASLDEVVIYKGKTSKKNNPAIDILRKIWDNRRENGVKKFKQYNYDKYEKLEFDLNTIDSALVNSRIFNGMEFIFEDIDTSRITGKTYLPIFLNEAISKVYGDNELNELKEVLKGNKNAGFSDNQTLIAFVKDLYSDYDIYDNYLKFFDKSFTSPLSRTGINVYNYVLSDSAYIGNKWCYNIIYYPRRKNELTFKGDFWVNDTTWAIKEINLEVTKSANINWVKDLYIEQEFDVLNDSIFLITKDYFQSDFAFNKKEKSRGMYGKRTTLYDNYKFDQKKDKKFYQSQVDPYNQDIYNRDDSFWTNARMEDLNKDEQKVYKLLDTLRTVKAFKRLYNVGTILATGYVEFNGWDFGPLFSTVGYNTIEGFRLRAGGRTYFTANDRWRIEGYGAYGFRDNKFKYGISGKYLVDRKSRLIVSAGNRRDVEQLGASLTNTNDVEGRSLASSSIVATGDNSRLTSINLSAFSMQIEPRKNFTIGVTGSYRTLKPADDDLFSLDFFDPETGEIKSEIKQAEIATTLAYYPGRKTTGYGVDKITVNDGDYAQLFLNYSLGLDHILESDFEYQKLQFFYRQPWNIGGFGVLSSSLEVGKTFGEVPLGLLSVVPGNQTYLSIQNTFPLLNFYEFVTDTYAAVHIEHNFNGRIFSRIPLLRKLNLRELVGIRGVWGELSDENIALDASGFLQTVGAPDEEIYWEYSVGVGNIFKVFRIDFHFRGNYFDNPDARDFGVTGSFGFYF
ncbi:carboxypeptidase-like regulatory domain-containing protein [Aquimarina sp. MMG015]|uniref:DUF5686 and carboxypeptidase-like regulatory domain-containing protein n=1 Tax=Aquimarina TaxID=290174 RepID=UPI00041758E3|nr:MULTISPECIES: DUF5686 and carboxypeptidase-like regulatory domain-containing protein [Aquimarina]AXT57963.1 carboxypeptidase-like regulatory domain-containing protein [Aquimarina sp. AD1]MBQ4803137.1 carboxypeptidase-like regulatory domain-containing protein [Aquimarina sp. MMG015]RKN27909.1 carboxypeptidase-like regulatory domain-containing protein [Aquimarina sp. AD1]